MKKRITALLLCLVMAFSLIPTTVWAAGNETQKVKMQILHVSEKYNLGYNYTSSESMTYTYTCQYSYCGSGSYNHSMKLSDIKAAAQQMEQQFGVKFDGWTKTASANPQIFQFSSSGTTATQTTYTIYLVVKEAFTPPTPASSLLDEKIIVRDTTNPSLHVEQRFNVNATEWNNAVKSADGKTWTVTVNSSNYVPSFNDSYGVTHTLVNSADAQQTFTLTYANGSWTVSPSEIVFKVQCTPQPDFDKIFNSETVRVTDLNTTDGHGTKTYPLIAGRYASVKNSDTQYTITVWGADYIKDYQDSFPGVTHNTVDGSNKTIVLNYSNGVWTPTPANVTFTVECEPQPVAPNAPSDDQVSVISEPVMVDCVTPNRDAHGALPRPFISGTWARNTEKGVYENNGDYYFDVTITDPAAYVNEYNSGSINGVSLAGHTYTETGSRLTVTLKYNADTKTWQRSQQALVNCECEADLPIPTDDDIDNALKGRRFLIQDVASTNAHSTKVFSITDVAEADRIDSSSLRPVTVEELQAKYPDKNYTSNPYKTENGEILYFLTVADATDLDPYIDAYNNHEDIGVEHKYRYHSYTILEKKDTGWVLYDSYISRVAVLCDPVPNAPSIDDLKDLLKGLVNVDCSLLKEHDVKAYDTVMDTLKSSALKVERGTDGSFFCNVELDPAKLDTYVEKYSSEFIAPAHEADVEDENTDLTVKLIWNASAKKWAVAKDDTFTIITKCQLAPAAPDLTDLDGAVIVNCVGAGDHGSKTYALKEGTYTLDWVYEDGTRASQVRWDTTANTWRYDVLVCNEEFEGIDGFAPYVTDFNKLTGVEHDRTPYSYDGIILLWEEGHWTDDQSTWIAGHWYVDEAAYVGLTCSPAAPNADMLKYLVSVDVSCRTKPAKHDTRSYDLTDGYFSTEVYQEDGVYFCRVTLNKTQAQYYVNPKFSKDEGINKNHKLKEITKDSVLLVWYEEPLISMLDGENGNNHNGRWVLADEETGKLAVTATCSGGGNGGGTTPTTPTTETKTVKSGKTFDAGIAMYVGLGILSMTGSAVVIRKKKEF